MKYLGRKHFPRHCFFVLLLLLHSLLCGCSSIQNGDNKNNSIIAEPFSSTPAAKFAVSRVVLIDGSQSSLCDAVEKDIVKNLINDWIKTKIQPTGSSDSILYVTINDAFLCKLSALEEKYSGLYNITFKIITANSKSSSYVELNVVAENYRIIKNTTVAGAKKAMLHEQLAELRKLLESEFFDKKEIYFADYLVR